MAENSKIEWTHHTFNPWRGCTKVSPGCANCYAETMAKRKPAVLGEWGPNGTRIVASESMWRQPIKWNRDAEKAGERRRVFCASMADVFEDREELIEPRRRLWRLILDTPYLDWLLLTKRPENFDKLYPVKNGVGSVWLGVSVEDQQRADERIPILLQTAAAVRFLSVEPLLGEINLDPLWVGWGVAGYDHGRGKVLIAHRSSPTMLSQKIPAIDWTIVGGESGPQARPCNVEWIRSIVDECREARIPCFVKQLGSRPYERELSLWPVGTSLDGDGFGNYFAALRDSKGGDPSEWPRDLRVREFPAAQEVSS